MVEVFLDGCIAGHVGCRNRIVRTSIAAGDHETARLETAANGGNVKISASMQREILGAALTSGNEWVNELERDCRTALDTARAASLAGAEVDSKILSKQLAAVIRSKIEPASESKLEFAKRTKPISTQSMEQWRAQRIPKKWQKELKQYQDWKAGKRRIPPKVLKQQQAFTRMKTGWNRWYNTGAVKKSLDSPAVVYLQYTLGSAAHHTDICLARQGWVIPKGDSRLALNMPPMHWGCTARWIPVTKAAAKKYKIKRYTPAGVKEMEPAEGFGGYKAR